MRLRRKQGVGSWPMTDAEESLRALEAERFVQPERVVVEVGDDDQPCNAVLGDGTTRGFDHEARANPSTPKGKGGVNGLEAPPAGGRDNPAASYHRSRRTVESDIPCAAPRAKQGAQVVEPLAAESPVRVLVMPGIVSLHLQLHDRIPELHVGALGRVERPDSHFAALPRVRPQLSNRSDEGNALVQVVPPIDELTDWRQALPLLEENFPDWIFEPAWSS